jgi:hypothetical protein
VYHTGQDIVRSECFYSSIREDVAGIVLVYVNHGNGRRLGADGEKIRGFDFSEIAVDCAEYDKSLLLVLSGSFSADFPERVWADVQRSSSPALAEAVAAHVGFIASAGAGSFCSKAMVTAERGVVCELVRRPWAAGWICGGFSGAESDVPSPVDLDACVPHWTGRRCNVD